MELFGVLENPFIPTHRYRGSLQQQAVCSRGTSSKLRHELGSSPTDFCGSPNVIFKTGFSVYEQRRRVKHSVESHGIAHLEYTIQVKYEVLRR